MSRRSSKASLRASPSKGPGEIKFHFETGESYRPYTSVDRIKSIDAKKLSAEDPRLSNVSKEVPRENIGVFSINEAKAEDSPLTTSAIGMTVKSEEPSTTLSLLHPGGQLLADTQQLCYNQEQTLNLPYESGGSEYLGQPCALQYEMSQLDVNDPMAHNPSLAISIDFFNPSSEDAFFHEFPSPSTVGAPVSGLPYPSPQTEAYSPADSYTSSPALSDPSNYDYIQSSPFTYYPQASKLAEIYPQGYDCSQQYPDLMPLALPNCSAFQESPLNFWHEQKAHPTCSNPDGVNSLNVGFFNET